MSSLARHLRLPTLTLYGVGVIVGAGIFVLIGKIVGVVGNATWLAFLAAAVGALPTGLSYAELASRYPKSAGEAVFAERAFGRPVVSFLVGYLILASGVASTAAVAHGFSSYFGDLIGMTGGGAHLAIVVVFLAMLTWLNHRGIQEATWVNVLCTVTSVAALLIIVVAGASHWGSVDLFAVSSIDPGAVDTGANAASDSSAAVVLSGMALAFYAYIGFEDICNVAEEVQQPVRTIPRAILLALAVSTVIYVLVAVTAVSAVPAAELAASEVPLVLVSERVLPSLPTGWLSIVALFATTNTALFNLIMSSRIVYGMANQGSIPRRFAAVHDKRRTPSWGVAAAFVLATTFALTGVLKVLAEATNIIILTAFMAVNLSLVAIKLRNIPSDDTSEKHFNVPLPVPIVGALTAAYMASHFSLGAYVRAGGLLAVGVALYAIQAVLRRKAS
jgi:amino acid transporter